VDRAVRSGHPERSTARSGDAAASAAVVAVAAHASDPDLAEALKASRRNCCPRAAMCCCVDSLQASASLAQIDALLDIDDEASPDSQS
jgi:hypothetical protein